MRILLTPSYVHICLDSTHNQFRVGNNPHKAISTCFHHNHNQCTIAKPQQRHSLLHAHSFSWISLLLSVLGVGRSALRSRDARLFLFRNWAFVGTFSHYFWASATAATTAILSATTATGTATMISDLTRAFLCHKRYAGGTALPFDNFENGQLCLLCGRGLVRLRKTRPPYPKVLSAGSGDWGHNMLRHFSYPTRGHSQIPRASSKAKGKGECS